MMDEPFRTGRIRVAAGVAAVALAATVGAAPAATGAGGDVARASACPGTFQVLHNDAIGKLKIPAGAYTISVKRIACADAVNNFRDFLQRPGGDLPDNWRILVNRKKFVNRVQNVSFLIDKAPSTTM